jgi:hypothetical protein
MASFISISEKLMKKISGKQKIKKKFKVQGPLT